MARIYGRQVLKSHTNNSGTVDLVVLTDCMYAVIITNPENQVVRSKNFVFTKDCEKEVLKECRSFYKFAVQCLSKKDLQPLLDED